jgi:VanZ family protein
VGVLAMALFLALSFAYLLRSDRLPNVFDGLAALAALLDAMGFVFDYYQRVPLYDEVAHAITIFSFTLAFFYLVYREEVPRRHWVMAVAVFTSGVALASLWEIAEWTTGRILDTEVVFGLDDAITDLMANSVGALAAAIVALRVPHDRESLSVSERGRSGPGAHR